VSIRDRYRARVETRRAYFVTVPTMTVMAWPPGRDIVHRWPMMFPPAAIWFPKRLVSNGSRGVGGNRPRS
jgi:hypothetical protein